MSQRFFQPIDTERAQGPFLEVIAPKCFQDSWKTLTTIFTKRRINIGPLKIEAFVDQNKIKVNFFFSLSKNL